MQAPHGLAHRAARSTADRLPLLTTMQRRWAGTLRATAARAPLVFARAAGPAESPAPGAAAAMGTAAAPPAESPKVPNNLVVHRSPGGASAAFSGGGNTFERTGSSPPNPTGPPVAQAETRVQPDAAGGRIPTSQQEAAAAVPTRRSVARTEGPSDGRPASPAPPRPSDADGAAVGGPPVRNSPVRVTPAGSTSTGPAGRVASVGGVGSTDALGSRNNPSRAASRPPAAAGASIPDAPVRTTAPSVGTALPSLVRPAPAVHPTGSVPPAEAVLGAPASPTQASPTSAAPAAAAPAAAVPALATAAPAAGSRTPVPPASRSVEPPAPLSQPVGPAEQAAGSITPVAARALRRTVGPPISLDAGVPLSPGASSAARMAGPVAGQTRAAEQRQPVRRYQEQEGQGGQQGQQGLQGQPLHPGLPVRQADAATDRAARAPSSGAAAHTPLMPSGYPQMREMRAVGERSSAGTPFAGLARRAPLGLAAGPLATAAVSPAAPSVRRSGTRGAESGPDGAGAPWAAAARPVDRVEEIGPAASALPPRRGALGGAGDRSTSVLARAAAAPAPGGQLVVRRDELPDRGPQDAGLSAWLAPVPPRPNSGGALARSVVAATASTPPRDGDAATAAMTGPLVAARAAEQFTGGPVGSMLPARPRVPLGQPVLPVQRSAGPAGAVPAPRFGEWVQRAVEPSLSATSSATVSAVVARAEGAPAAAAASAPPAELPAVPAAAAQPEPDLSQLADQVYTLLVRRLADERDRRGW